MRPKKTRSQEKRSWVIKGERLQRKNNYSQEIKDLTPYCTGLFLYKTMFDKNVNVVYFVASEVVKKYLFFDTSVIFSATIYLGQDLFLRYVRE